MRNTKFIAPALVGLLLAAASGPVAGAERADAQALARAKLSLTQAIEAAEQQGSGKAIDAEFEARENTASQYEIKILGADKLITYTLDANTGKVVDTDNSPIEKLFTRLKPEDVRGSRTSLIQAIGIAEQRAGGKAIDAEVDREGDAVRYDVTVVKADGSEHAVEIDGASGKASAH